MDAKIYDAILTHHLYFERYEKHVTNEFKKIFKILYTRTISELNNEEITTNNQKRLLAFLKNIKTFEEEFSLKTSAKISEFIDEFVLYETEAEPFLLKEAMPDGVDIVGFTAEKLAAATSEYMQTGQTIAGMFSALEKSTLDFISKESAIGFLNGETTPQIIRRLKDREMVSDRHLSSTVRTSLNHIANQARRIIGQENSDVVKYVQWVSSLDFRTSDICRYRDNKKYKLNEKTPFPPAHINCRSTVVYITYFDDLENEAPRAALGGGVDSKANYYDFLKRQKKSVIEDVLGKERAQLFFSGKLKGEQLHARDGKMLSIDELKIKFKELF